MLNRSINFLKSPAGKGILCLLCLFSSICHLSGQGKLSEKQESFAAVAEKAMPAVVTIYSIQFQGGKAVPVNVGSGFFISGDGYIVTNYHVIEKAQALVVKTAKSQTFPATVTGVSQRTDLAVLKISHRGRVPYLRFADTDKVKVGHYAIAIGSPFALSQTMTTGIVSYKGRELGLHYKEDYIQTDAAINPGNSGGPLLDISGKVIGVNDCIIGPSAVRRGLGNVGLGFAIDGNLARIVVQYILKSKSAVKPSLGVQLTEYRKHSPPVITKVLPNTPAAAAGLMVGDSILKIGKRKISSLWDVQITVPALYDPGDEAVITFQRKKRVMRTKIKFGKVR